MRRFRNCSRAWNGVPPGSMKMQLRILRLRLRMTSERGSDDPGSDDAGSAMLGVTMPRSLCEVSLGMTSERGSADDNQCPQIPGSILEAEIGNQRQMVRCDQSGAGAPEVRRLEMQRWFVIAVIQAQEGKHARIGARELSGMSRAEGLEPLAQQSGGEAARPFVEV